MSSYDLPLNADAIVAALRQTGRVGVSRLAGSLPDRPANVAILQSVLERIADLASSGEARHRSYRFIGYWFVGLEPALLRGIELPAALEFIGCLFSPDPGRPQEPIRMMDLVLDGLLFRNTEVEGPLELRDVAIGRHFQLVGCGLRSLRCLDLSIEGDVRWSDTLLEGFGPELPSLHVERLRVGGNLRLSRVAIDGDARVADARVGGDAFLEDFENVRGRLDMPGIEVAKALVVGTGGNRLRIDSRIDQALTLTAARLGELRFRRCHIGPPEDLEAAAESAPLQAVSASNDPKPVRLDLSDARIGSNVIFHSGVHVLGRVDMSHAVVKGHVVLAGAKLVAPNEVVLSLEGAKLGRLVMPSRPENRVLGDVSLRNAHARGLADYSAAWPQVGLPGRLDLEGFTYEVLENPDGTDRPAVPRPGETRDVASARKSWLEVNSRAGNLPKSGRTAGASPQPWTQLAQVLERQGEHGAAVEIAIDGRLRRRDTLARADQRLADWVLYRLSRYGYDPLLTLRWAFRAFVLFTIPWVVAWSGCEVAGCHDQKIMVRTLERNYMTADRRVRSDAYPPFNPVSYSLGVFLPVVDLRTKAHWSHNPRLECSIDHGCRGAVMLPHGSPTPTYRVLPRYDSQTRSLWWPLGAWMGWLYALEAASGVILVSLTIAGFAGLLRDGGRRR